MADQNPGGLPSIELPLEDGDILLISRDGVELGQSTYGALKEQISVPLAEGFANSLEALAQSTSQSLSEKLDADAADDFATHAQGVKADNAITYDVATQKYKKPDGSDASLGRNAALMNNGVYVTGGDSRNRRDVTPTGSITTLDSYNLMAYVNFFLFGKLRLLAIAGNSGYDIKEGLDIALTKPPCNSLTSTGAGAETTYGYQGVDLTKAGLGFFRYAINFWSDFNFTLPTFADREAINAVRRAEIEAQVERHCNFFINLPLNIFQTEGPVGAASVNFNGGDIIERGYIWHLKWFTEMLFSKCAKYPNLVIFDPSKYLVDVENVQYVPKRYFTLTPDGSQANQDMHEAHRNLATIAPRLADLIRPFLMDLKPGFAIAKSDRMGISKDSLNVYRNSLFLDPVINTPKVLVGAGNGTVVPVTHASITGEMPDKIAVQINQTGIAIGNFTIVCKMIPATSGEGKVTYGRALQVDLTANVDFDGSMGLVLYDLGESINAAIDAGLITFNEQKVIQSSGYIKAGLAGANDGEVVDFNALRSFSYNQRGRTVGPNTFTTATAYGSTNSNTDYSVKTDGLQLPGKIEGVMKSPAVKIEGITPLTPNRMQVRTIAAPNSNEYWYFAVSAKVLTGQKARLIFSNPTLAIASMPENKIITDII